jgi:UDP-glucose 4-epimerase
VRLLITGIAGFIGANLARRAAADPAVSHLRGIDDLSTGTLDSLTGLDVDLIQGSILDPAALDAALADRDAVVHLAALASVPRSLREPLASHTANVTGTLVLLEAARRHDVRHVVLASSSSVYGANPTLPAPELTWTRPLSPYAASKLAAEAYALAYQASFGLPTLALRFFNVYGPGQRHDHPYAAVIPRFVHAALAGEPVLVHGDGRQSRDFTHVEAVCAVLLDAVRRRVCHPGPVNLAFGVRTELRAVLTELEGLLGRPIDRRYAQPRPGDVRDSAADPATLRQLFPELAPVPLRTGLADTVAWFQQREHALAPA